MSKLAWYVPKTMKPGDAFKINGSAIGYYMVTKNGRYYIGKYSSGSDLSRCADKVLTEVEYEYWVDYYHGLDIDGYHHWINIDLSDLFPM